MSVSTLLIIWSITTAVLVIVLIYRGTLSMREEDQLFLDDAQSHIQKEQAALLHRMGQLQWPLRFLCAASGLLGLLLLSLWLWEGLNRTM